MIYNFNKNLLLSNKNYFNTLRNKINHNYKLFRMINSNNKYKFSPYLNRIVKIIYKRFLHRKL